MLVNRPLWRWYARRAWPVTIIASCIVLVHVLLIQRQPYSTWESSVWLFILLHCVALNWSVNSIGHADGAFLYTRGFSRDVLWRHRVFVSLVHMLIVWGIAAGLLWSGLRSQFQIWLMDNPEFPLMDGADSGRPWAWLYGYILLLGSLQYASIRRWQPTRGAASGYWLVLSVVVLQFTGVRMQPWNETLIWSGAAGLIVVSCLIAGRLLHREIEVQS